MAVWGDDAVHDAISDTPLPVQWPLCEPASEGPDQAREIITSDEYQKRLVVEPSEHHGRHGLEDAEKWCSRHAQAARILLAEPLAT